MDFAPANYTKHEGKEGAQHVISPSALGTRPYLVCGLNIYATQRIVAFSIGLDKTIMYS